MFSTNVTGQSPLEQGYTALVAGRLDDAAHAYNAALANNPLEPDALLGLAYVAHSKGRRDDALALYSKVLRVDPSNSIAQSGLIALDAGAAGANKGDRAKALVTNQPDSAAAQALAANTLAQEGLVAEAALAFGRAHALEPGNPWHSYNLAVALDKLGNYTQAIDQYDKALQNAGNSPSPLSAQRIQSVRLRLEQLRDLPDLDSGAPR
jgi:tetratricopeptide (TPR) repeat protein